MHRLLPILMCCACSVHPELDNRALAIEAETDSRAGERGPNVIRRENPDKLFPIVTTTVTRPDAIAELGELEPELVPPVPPEDDTAALGGEHIIVTNIPDGHLVGSFGAGPCVILSIWCYDGTVYSFHFMAGEDVAATLARYTPFPEECHGALAGGDNSGLSNQIIQDIRNALTGQNVVIDGFYPGTGIWAVPDAGGFKWVRREIDAPLRQD